MLISVQLHLSLSLSLYGVLCSKSFRQQSIQSTYLFIEAKTHMGISTTVYKINIHIGSKTLEAYLKKLYYG